VPRSKPRLFGGSRQPHVRREGIAYVLAMFYLLLFTVLSIGFYAASTMSVQIARNDRWAADAQSAAESGMEFVRDQLGRLTITSGTTDDHLLPEIALQFGSSLNGSATMNGHAVEVTENVIFLPAPAEFIALDPALGTRFRLQIAARGGSVWVKVVGYGRNASIGRAIQMEFRKASRSAESDRFIPVPGSYEELAP
jgi:hypothetical protein